MGFVGLIDPGLHQWGKGQVNFLGESLIVAPAPFLCRLPCSVTIALQSQLCELLKLGAGALSEILSY